MAKFEKKYGEDIRLKVCQMYDSGMSLESIAKQLGMGSSSAHRLASSGCKMRKPKERHLTCREDAFSTVTEESAYWAGFLMADGSVTAKHPTHQRSTRISLKYEDKPHLQKFMDWLELDSKITNTKRKVGDNGRGRYVPVEEREFDSCTMSVTCEQIAADLERYGIVHRKTYCAEATALIAMNKDFWRGCIDGDGCIMVRRRVGKQRVSPAITLVGTKAIVSQFKNFVRANIPACDPAMTLPKGKVIYQCCVNGANAIELARILYGNCTVALDRKLERAKDMLSLDYGAAMRERNKNANAPDGMAWCGRCQDYLPRTAFSVVKGKSNGLHGRCMQCNREYNAEYRRKPKKQLLFAT